MSNMRISTYYDLKCSIFPEKVKMFKGRVCENGSPGSDRGGSLFRIRNIIS
jgi:hypothetical protein